MLISQELTAEKYSSCIPSASSSHPLRLIRSVAPRLHSQMEVSSRDFMNVSETCFSSAVCSLAGFLRRGNAPTGPRGVVHQNPPPFRWNRGPSPKDERLAVVL